MPVIFTGALNCILRYTLLLLLATCPITYLTGQQGKIFFDHIGIEDGLPQGHIFSMMEDSEGFLWFCTLGGLAKYDGYRFTNYLNDSRDSTSISASWAFKILEDRNGRYWVTTNRGLNRLDRRTGKFTRYVHDPNNPGSISDDRVHDVYEDRQGRIWVANGSGVDLFDTSKNRFLHFSGNQTFIGRHSPVLYEHTDGNLFAATPRGLFLVNWRDTSLLYLPIDQDSVLDIRSMIRTSTGHTWLASSTGLWTVDLTLNKAEKVDIGIPEAALVTLLEHPGGILWIGTEHQGLLRFDLKTRRVTHHFTAAPDDPDGLNNNVIYSLMTDRLQNLWIGTFNGISRINPGAQKFQLFQNAQGLDNMKNYILRIHEDRAGKVWTNTMEGIYVRQSLNGAAYPLLLPPKFKPGFCTVTTFFNDQDGLLWFGVAEEGLYRHNPFTNRTEQMDAGTRLKNKIVSSIAPDKNNPNWLWLGTRNGLCHLNKKNLDTAWVYPTTWLPNLKNNNVATVLQAPDGKLWLRCTGALLLYDPRTGKTDIIDTSEKTLQGEIRAMTVTDAGLWLVNDQGLIHYNPASRQQEHYTAADGLAQSDLCALLARPNGQIWLASQNYLSRFDPATRSFHNYSLLKEAKEFNTRSSCQTADGRLFFGGINGFVAFDPDRIPVDTLPPRMVLTGFSALNKTMDFGTVPEFVRHIRLNYTDNVFTFHYAGLHFTNPGALRYRYKMEGFNDDWQEAGDRREATYTNLPPGKYTFMADAANADGRWSGRPLVVQVRIEPPFWQRWWFYLLLALACCSIGYAIFRNRLHAQRLAREKELAEQNARYKSQFLTNMSHEIRTPMNAIIGLNKLLLDSGLNEKQKQYVKAIAQSGENLLWIVNDILDQAKIESGKFSFVERPFELDVQLEQLRNLFLHKALENQIEYSIHTAPGVPNRLLGDPLRLQQVLTNLVGNAIKFTRNGLVRLDVALAERTDTHARIQFDVRDTGIGIPAEKLDLIFESFEQVDDEDFANQRGTGLGLSIARQMVEQQGGSISVQSTIGKGATFTVVLPFKIAQGIAPTLLKAPAGKYVLKNLKILLVEDAYFNQMLALELLKKHIENVEVDIAENGLIAVEKIRQKTYDLVLMDIKMPVMDGYEATRAIRKMPDDICNVPILALTANAIPEQLEQCRAVGMNDCITKPIDSEELLEKIERLTRKG